MPLKQVVLIGAGNVGWHLGQRFREKKIPVAQVYSRRLDRAANLAKTLKCPATDNLKELLPLDHCLYLIAVKDDAIAAVATQISYLSGTANRAFAHTSGAVASTVLDQDLQRIGVFYPLQTLSRDRPVDFDQVPICIYSPDEVLSQQLSEVARQISQQVELVNDQQRSVLHIAAVFVNNFSNYLFGVGKEIVEQDKLSFDLLRPLIAETAAKVMESDPGQMQTGPAVRNDESTILSHLRYLERYPDHRDLYRMISRSIIDRSEKKKNN